jgi:hypothetical protein
VNQPSHRPHRKFGTSCYPLFSLVILGNVSQQIHLVVGAGRNFSTGRNFPGLAPLPARGLLPEMRNACLSKEVEDYKDLSVINLI